MEIPSPTRRFPAGPALRVIRQRAVQAASVVLLVSTACFAIIQSLPGDIAFRIAAGRYGYDQVTAASADTVRAELGLDRPAWQQLLDWLGDLVTLDLGTSLVTGTGVAGELGLYLSSSLQLAGAALAHCADCRRHSRSAGRVPARRGPGPAHHPVGLRRPVAAALPARAGPDPGFLGPPWGASRRGARRRRQHRAPGGDTRRRALRAVCPRDPGHRGPDPAIGVRPVRRNEGPGRPAGFPPPRAQERRRNAALLRRGAAADPHRGRRRRRKPVRLAGPGPRPGARDLLAGPAR